MRGPDTRTGHGQDASGGKEPVEPEATEGMTQPAEQDARRDFTQEAKDAEMSTEVVQSVTSKKSDIPSHYIAISSYGCHKGNTDKKASEEYKSLYRAWCDERIGGIKFMHTVHDKRGQIFVDPSDADRVISESTRPKTKPVASAQAGSERSLQFRVNGVAAGQVEAAVVALCEINNGITLMQATLERLTAAVQGIATQPKTAQHELLSAINGNGFHN